MIVLEINKVLILSDKEYLIFFVHFKNESNEKLYFEQDIL